MNRYPMVFAPRSWSPNLRPWCVKLLRPFRKREIRNKVRLASIEVRGGEHVAAALRAGQRLMLTPNHPSHADPYAIYEACEQVGTTCHIMAAWHVFAKYSPLMQKFLQWHGCFSVDREANDLTAFKDAVSVLRERIEPLVIFPEGDIYHSNDRVTPFREGAAAIAIGAARRSEQAVVIVPTALRYRYVDDPTPYLERTVAALEERILWRPRHGQPLVPRIQAIGEAVLGLKELEFYGHSGHGPLPSRITALAEFILGRLESRYSLTAAETVPKRVKQIRQTILTRFHDQQTPQDLLPQLRKHLDEAFLVLQLFSYPGNYLKEDEAVVERIAETVDKLEEDVLQVPTASIRCARRVLVEFGQPIPVPTSKSRDAAASLIQAAENAVRQLLLQNGGEQPLVRESQSLAASMQTA
jgi:1-acyl-sn-glycerol-3-phosphate acyltransferase